LLNVDICNHSGIFHPQFIETAGFVNPGLLEEQQQIKMIRNVPWQV
jgi:hypothetical protein